MISPSFSERTCTADLTCKLSVLFSRGAEKPFARVLVSQFLQSRSKMISLSTLTFLRLVMLYSGKYAMAFSMRVFF